jgi:hypothetical protein
MMRSFYINPAIYGEGYEAYILGWNNPYTDYTDDWSDFEAGWQDACDGNVDTKSEYAAGGQLNVNWTNEEIRSLLDVKMDYVMLQIGRLREFEAEEARKAAEPFWRKWLGA